MFSAKMQVSLVFGVFICTIGSLQAETKAPQVDVYTRYPVENGKENVVICYARRFHPHIISMSLKEDGKVMSGVQELDLSFDPDWTFRKVIYANFIPGDGKLCTCDVNHLGQEPISYKLDPLM
ncbi:beta-2-microglobulin [Microcaecilia unicolor]|uniref:Beta-2-microglobulin-like n=1 Tax=Microcaecilia unicolor TaxID=1415580 RepID=A0A6P7YP84_9AMPH|nr:beta-2-microglobulin-like [Microcaecilia unicolor]